MKPPAIATRLLERIPNEEHRELIRADLADEYRERVESGSRLGASIWYWVLCIRSVRDARRSDRTFRPSVDRTSMAREARQAVRLIVRRPGLSITVIAAMVIGFGATAVVSSLLVDVVLEPLPIPEPDRVVSLSRSAEGAPEGYGVVGLPDMRDWRERTRTFSDIAGWTTTTANWTGEGEPELIRVTLVTEGLDRVLGLGLHVGREFASEEFEPGVDRVVLLTHAFWSTRFAGDERIVGESLVLNSEPHRIIGVLAPQALPFPNADVQLWKPFAPLPDGWQVTIRGASWLNAVGRMRPDVSLAGAQSELTTIQSRLVQEFPRDNAGQDRVILTPLKERVVGSVRTVLWIVLAAGGLVLFVATANTSVLLLTRSSQRIDEFRLRMALGGSRSRLVRQLFLETGALVGVGALLGVAAAPVLIRGIFALYPGDVPRSAEVSLGAETAALVLGLSLVVIVAVSTLSYLGIRRSASLSGRGATDGGRTRRRIRRTLAAGQVAMAGLLVYGSVLFVGTLVNLENQDVGFEPESVLSFRVSLSVARYPGAVETERFFRDLLSNLESMPEVESAGATSSLPFLGGVWGSSFRIADRGERTETDAVVRVTTPGYDRALGIPLLAGRTFEWSDLASSARVVVVNRTAAEALGGEAAAVGRVIEAEGELREVVGVLGDVRHRGLGEASAPELYFPQTQIPRQVMTVAVRAATPDALALLPMARSAVTELDDQLAISHIATMEERIRRSVGDERFRAYLATTLGLVAVLLAMVGIYGVMSQTVAHRHREIGVRMALGEAPRGVLAGILRDATTLGVWGVVLGSLLSLLGLRALESMVFGLNVYDWTVQLAVPVTLLALTGLAGAPAALRASRLDPVQTLSDR